MPASPDLLLQVRGLRTELTSGSSWRRRGKTVAAVDGVDLDLCSGTTLGLVGESGSGKSTLARTIVGLTRPAAGSVVFQGQDLSRLSPAAVRRTCRDMQMIFQDPRASLNPRRTVAQIVAEGWTIHRDLAPRDVRAEVERLLVQVGLDPSHADRYPHQFSGGQRQRISIARALAMKPRLIICDEAVSALDVSIQAQVLNLLKSLRAELGVAYLFISHDLSVVRHVSDTIAVMRRGRIVEAGSRDQIFSAPRHEYTRTLLSSIPRLRPWADDRTSEMSTP